MCHLLWYVANSTSSSEQRRELFTSLFCVNNTIKHQCLGFQCFAYLQSYRGVDGKHACREMKYILLLVVFPPLESLYDIENMTD